MGPEPCHYGTPREQCHVGCGRYCGAKRRHQDALKLRLAIRHEEEADLYAALADHPGCGTAECCGGCPGAVG
jgi:hypothetical protein